MSARFKLLVSVIRAFVDRITQDRRGGFDKLSDFAKVLLFEAIHKLEMLMLLVLPSFWGRSMSSAAVTLNMNDDDENEEDDENVMYYDSIVEELVPLFEHVLALGMYDVSLDEVFVDIMRYWDAHM